MENPNVNKQHCLPDMEALLGEHDERLHPMLFVHIFCSFIDEPAVQRTRNQMLHLLGNSLPEDIHSYLMGSENGYNTIGKRPDYPDTQQEWQKQSTAYYLRLKNGKLSFREDTFRPKISHLGVRIPLDKFTDPQAFLKWVLSLELLQSPSLFSATAGYYLHADSFMYGKKFDAFLMAHPGFEYIIENTVDRIGSIYSEQHRILKPELARINWLNALGADAYLLVKGGQEGLRETIRQWPELVLHTLSHGFMVQAGPQPSPGENGRAPEEYYAATQLLEPFLKLDSHTNDLETLDWAEHFYTPERMKKVKERKQLWSRLINWVD
jgi:Protein of unknown function (DUF3396).